MLNQTQRLFIILVIANLTALGACGSAFTWIRHTTLKTEELNNELRREAEQDARFRATAELVADTDAERETLGNYFVSESGIVNVITLLESLGDIVGAGSVRVVSITTDPRQDAVGTRPFFVRLQTDGSWRAVQHLLALLESVPRAMFVDTVSLSYRLDTGGEGAESSGPWHGIVTMQILSSEEPSDMSQ